MLITLTTDFGYVDPFVGIMKGVIARINPQVQVVDLSHGIPPQDVMAGALVLRNSIAFFPRNTIHVAVIDPEVGSIRRPLLVESDGKYLIGPDNGVLSLALQNTAPDRLIHLSNSSYHLQPTSATFHGRDIFAPVAAHLSLGVDPTLLGDPVDRFVHLAWPQVFESKLGIEGEIIHIDRFGNLFTNVSDEDLLALRKDQLRISLGNIIIDGVVQNYAAGEDGRFIALINSSGLLEIAVYKDSAQYRCKSKIGDKVRISVLGKVS
jgi:S-adenosylmethionine hydrolase